MFDPYHKWLGILPKDQPPNHYRLLALEPFESDLDVIEGAADRAMGYIRNYQSGEHAAQAAKLLNEIATARLCLLKPKSKASYDTKLRMELPIPAADQSDGVSFAFDPELAAVLPAPKAPRTKGGSQSHKKNSPKGFVIAVGIGAAVLVLSIGLLMVMSGKPRNKTEPIQQEIVESSQSTRPQPPVKELSTTSEPVTAPKVVSVIESKLVVEPAGSTVDLIQAVDLPRDRVMGEWKKEGTSLIGGPNAGIYFPAKFPEDYQLKFHVKRITGNDTLAIGIVMAGRLGMVAFDAYGSKLCGMYLDGREPNGNCTTRPGALFQNDRLSTIVLTIRPGNLLAAVDGQTVIKWHGQSERMYCHTGHSLPNRESLFVGMSQASYQLELAEMTPIKPEPQSARIPKLQASMDLMPVLDTERDSEVGMWALNKNVLHSPEAHCKFSLPVSVPEEYTLSLTAERSQDSRGLPVLIIGLPVGNSYCTIAIVDEDCAGIEKIDGLRWNINETRLGGNFLPRGKPVNIACTVTKRAIRMDLDGRTLINWTGDSRRLSVQEDSPPSDARKLLFGTETHLKLRDIKLGPPIDPPRIPDHPPLAIGRPLNLLSLIDPNRDALNGTWTKENTELRVKGENGVSKLVIPCEVPEEYKLTIRVAREPGGVVDNQCLAFNLPIESSMGEILLDAYASKTNGIYLDRLLFDDPRNVSLHPGQAIPMGPSREIVVSVRKTGLKVTREGETIVDWVGNPNRLAMQHEWCTPMGRIALCSWQSNFRFEKVEIEPLEPSSFSPVAQLGSDGNLMSIIDPVRDSRKGQWRSEANGVVSPMVDSGRLNVPVIPPPRYVLTADVERKQGIHQFALGLIVDGHSCSAVIDGGDYFSGLERVDDIGFHHTFNPTFRKHPEAVLPQGKRARLRCFVLSDAILVTCNDKEIIRWRGDPRRLSQGPAYLPPNDAEIDHQQLCLWTYHSEFLIRELTLKPLSDEEAEQIAGRFKGGSPSGPPANIPTKPAATKPANTFPEDLGKLVILNARYGVDDEFVDITQRLTTAANTGLLLLVVDDSLGSAESGDSTKPIAVEPGRKAKTLQLRYRLNGIEKSETVEQDHVVQIDVRPASSKKDSKAFKLLEARRGFGLYDESTWEDVTASLRPFVKKDFLTLTDEEFNKVRGAGSKASAVVTPKTLFVRYQYEGEESMELFPSGKSVLLGDSPLRPGLIKITFDGTDFKTRLLTQIAPDLSIDFGSGGSAPGLPSDNFSVRWLGILNVPIAGTYTLFLEHDDGARLWLDQRQLIDKWADVGNDQIELPLLKKQYIIRMDYYDRRGEGKINLRWKSESIPLQIIPAKAFSHKTKDAKDLGLK